MAVGGRWTFGGDVSGNSSQLLDGSEPKQTLSVDFRRTFHPGTTNICWPLCRPMSHAERHEKQPKAHNQDDPISHQDAQREHFTHEDRELEDFAGHPANCVPCSCPCRACRTCEAVRVKYPATEDCVQIPCLLLLLLLCGKMKQK